jgi:hypothetical protein
MPRTPVEDRHAMYERLAPAWPVLLDDVRRFAVAAPDMAIRLGRLEVFLFLTDLPQRVEGQAAREAGRVSASNNGHAAGRREDAR